MKKIFFTPTKFEIAPRWSRNTKHFGMGRRNAERFAAKMNQEHKAYSKIIVYGCAGGLKKDLTLGSTFVVEEVLDGQNRFQILSQEYSHLPRARLFTSPKIVSNPDEKHRLRDEHQVDLVDMEMFYIWNSANEDFRSKLIFVRSVLDTVSEDMNFLISKDPWLSIDGFLKSFIKMLGLIAKLRRYRKSMDRFLRDRFED